jgi:hypothetical protein
MIYFFNISYIVSNKLANFELKIPLVHGETKTNCVKGKIELNIIV